MWYTWTTLILVSCTLVKSEIIETTTELSEPVTTTTQSPPRTLDRQAAELAWRIWLQSPESGNQNAPPRRITTKSLFITPLVCPKGQRLDRNACVEIVTVNKDEHERILLEQLNALFTSPPGGDTIYDYGDDDPGPLQLSIPIGLDPQASPLQSLEPSAQVPGTNNIQIDKKDNTKFTDASLEAELELMKLQNSEGSLNDTSAHNGTNYIHDTSNNLLSQDKPKRNSLLSNETEPENTDQGQKEFIYGHVKIDPITDTIDQNKKEVTDVRVDKDQIIQKLPEALPEVVVNKVIVNNSIENNNGTNANNSQGLNISFIPAEVRTETKPQTLKTNVDQVKLNPENDYSDIGETIKLISRFAEVSTDDNFNKDHKYTDEDDSILGTRTKLQHRRKPPKTSSGMLKKPLSMNKLSDMLSTEPSNIDPEPQRGIYFRYPWSSQDYRTPPPNYPFRNLQDYWPGQKPMGVYNMAHGNPIRHHHANPYNYLRPYYPYPYASYSDSSALREAYADQHHGYPSRLSQPVTNPVKSYATNQDLYSLLGLRHWFSNEDRSNR